MTMRVMLLVLAISFFVGIWKSDGSVTEPGTVAQMRTLPEVSNVVLTTHKPATDSTTPQCVVDDSANAAIVVPPVTKPEGEGQLLPEPESPLAAIEVSWTNGCCPAPLPEQIVAGTYQVVNERGARYLVDVTDCDLSYRGIVTNAPARDLYVVYASEARWYFIRVDTHGVDAESVELVGRQVDGIDLQAVALKAKSAATEATMEATNDHVSTVATRLWKNAGRLTSRLLAEMLRSVSTVPQTSQRNDSAATSTENL